MEHDLFAKSLDIHGALVKLIGTIFYDQTTNLTDLGMGMYIYSKCKDLRTAMKNAHFRTLELLMKLLYLLSNILNGQIISHIYRPISVKL